LIDVGDFFIDLGDIADLIRKDITQSGEYDVPSFVPPGGNGRHSKTDRVTVSNG